MTFGRRLWNLWLLRPWVAASGALALLMALWSVYGISILPPKLTPRGLEMATATTHAVVDTPTSSVLDLRQNSYDFDAMTQRAIVIGSVVANGKVRASIARAAKVSPDRLQITAPFTRKQPRATTTTNRKRASDILQSPDQYRINIQANPTVPILDFYAQAPSADEAETLANAAVDGLRTYLAELGAAQQIPEDDQLRLLQLGRATGTVINKGVDWQVAILVFIVTFSLACATTILLSRVKRGLQLARLEDQRRMA
jgi:propanediol dehydratase small subunit